jgi:hypothetical protein
MLYGGDGWDQRRQDTEKGIGRLKRSQYTDPESSIAGEHRQAPIDFWGMRSNQ